jgi:hypothetical protein
MGVEEKTEDFRFKYLGSMADYDHDYFIIEEPDKIKMLEKIAHMYFPMSKADYCRMTQTNLRAYDLIGFKRYKADRGEDKNVHFIRL